MFSPQFVEAMRTWKFRIALEILDADNTIPDDVNTAMFVSKREAVKALACKYSNGAYFENSNNIDEEVIVHAAVASIIGWDEVL